VFIFFNYFKYRIILKRHLLAFVSLRNRDPFFDGERTKEIPAGILHNRSLGNNSLNMSEMTIGCVCAEKMKL